MIFKHHPLQQTRLAVSRFCIDPAQLVLAIGGLDPQGRGVGQKGKHKKRRRTMEAPTKENAFAAVGQLKKEKLDA